MNKPPTSFSLHDTAKAPNESLIGRRTYYLGLDLLAALSSSL
jgi:hypothetical protein